VQELGASDVSIMKETAEATVEAARDKLKLWGLKDEQVEEIEKRGEPADHITIYAPMSGTVVHKNAQEGMYVQTGTRIYTIADLRRVWVLMDAYESDLEWLRYGQEVEFTPEAYAGETFVGLIAFIDPVVNAKTRTVKVRVNVPNLEGKLKPEMFVRALVRANVARGGRVMEPDLAGKWMCPMHPEVVADDFGACGVCGMDLVTTESRGYLPVDAAESTKPLVIPVSAALVTGTRAVVYVYVEDPEAEKAEKPSFSFEGREIVLGPRAGDHYIVRHGLKEGELVVTRGNFKIDSALQIEAKPSMMTPEGGGGGGHRHGEEPQKATDPATPQKMEVPPLVRTQLLRVAKAHETISAAMKADELGQAKAAFEELGEAIDQVDGEHLSGHNRMMWNELSMLLENDAFEGREATQLEEAEAVFALLERHAQRLREQFGLGHEHMATPELTEAAAPHSFRQQLADVWAAYRELHGALAGDDREAAIVASEGMQRALAAVDMTILDHQAHMAWMPMQERMQTALQETADAADLEGIRASFPAVSEALWEAIETFETAPAGPVYKLRCPRAFDGHGAIWLQRDQETRNPYFGAAMLKCGDVVETIVTESTPTGSKPEHE